MERSSAAQGNVWCETPWGCSVAVAACEPSTSFSFFLALANHSSTEKTDSRDRGVDRGAHRSAGTDTAC